MIEGQEGLNWDRWRRICADTERLGFASLRRSDHLISLMGPQTSERDCIECWESLALAAEWTKTIELGPMVSPTTFRLPGVLAKMAASVDSLSGGRLILGVGAGWNENEHAVFGIPFYTREAAEWNFSRLNPDEFRERRDELDRCCREIGRDPATVRRSVMTSFIVGRSRADVLERASQVREVVTPLGSLSTPEEVLDNRKDAWFVGTPEEIAERMRELSKLGIDLFMLQHFLLDDGDALQLLGEVAKSLQ